MIKFFRKIRQRLLAENKTSPPARPTGSSGRERRSRTGKYILYAIGEIILVIVGILFALQINNWNEANKNNKEETAILENLHENLILARKQSEDFISNEKKIKKELIHVLGIDSSRIKLNKDSISDDIFKNVLWNLESNVPVINAYSNLKNTGKLDLIKDRNLKEKFTSLEVNQNDLKTQLEDRLDVQQIRIDNVAENDVNFVRLIKQSIPTVNIKNEIQNDYYQILNNQRIRNLFGIKLVMTQDVLNYRENLNTEISELIMLIETELNKRK